MASEQGAPETFRRHAEILATAEGRACKTPSLQAARQYLCDVLVPELRFDAIIVDEAQDFDWHWWDSLEQR